MALEAKLSQLSQAFAAHKEDGKGKQLLYSKSTSQGYSLVELVRVEIFDFKAQGNRDKWLPPHYIAFVLHAKKGTKSLDD